MSVRIVLFMLLGVTASIVVWAVSFGRARTMTMPISDRIASPVFGVLDLTGGKTQTMQARDLEGLGKMFGPMVNSTNAPPRSDVLFIYGQLTETGEVVGSQLSLRQIIAQSGASLAVLATETTHDGWMKALDKKPAPNKINLVVTVERKGNGSFGRFFDRVFTGMKQGETLGTVWQRLAPQLSPEQHGDGPGLVMVCERGDVLFTPPAK